MHSVDIMSHDANFQKQFGYIYDHSLFFIILSITNKAVKLAPQANVLPQAAKVIKSTSRDGFKLDSAKPAYQRSKYGKTVEWNESFVLEMKRGLRACRVM